MTTELVKRLTELEAKATPGPWKSGDFKRVNVGGLQGPLMSYLAGNSTTGEGMTVSLGSERVADHELVAALRNAWPQIKAALESSHKQGWVMVPVETIRRCELMMEVAATTGIDAWQEGQKSPNAQICKQLSNELEMLLSALPSPPVKEK